MVWDVSRAESTMWKNRRRIPGLVALLLITGCQQFVLSRPEIVHCPLAAAEQASRVLSIAPLGTSREETLAALKQAGIEYSFGENQSICYCDLWKQAQEVWHIHVVLLFDEQGRLYNVRPNPAEEPRATAAAPEAAPGKPSESSATAAASSPDAPAR